MSGEYPMYRLEVTAPRDQPVQWFDTAEEALEAVNRLRAAHVSDLLIQDEKGTVMSIGQLAAIVIAQQLRTVQRSTRPLS